jgi:ribosomal protein L35
MTYAQTLQAYEALQVGDQVEITHDVKIGFRHWKTTSSGTVVRTARERHGLHFRRNADDRVYRDTLVLRRHDGQRTAVTLDEFSELNVLGRCPARATVHDD